MGGCSDPDGFEYCLRGKEETSSKTAAVTCMWFWSWWVCSPMAVVAACSCAKGYLWVVANNLELGCYYS